MLYDGTWLQKIALLVVSFIAVIFVTYYVGYRDGKKDCLLKQQSDALTIQEQVNQSAIIVQQEMEKVDAQMEHASTVSDDCNFVLNFDLTPCGVFD